MAQTSRYALPLLQAGQAQKEITHNDALARIDALLHLAVDSRHNSAATEANGTVWIVPAGASGAWAGHDGEIAIFDFSGWSFVAPVEGCVAFVRDEGIFIHYAGGQWRDAWTVPTLAVGGMTLSGSSPAAVTTPDGGLVVDVEARAALGQLLTTLRASGVIVAA